MPEIYVVTNRKLTGKKSLVSVLEEAVRAGVDGVILRENDLLPDELYTLACAVKDLCAGSGARFMVNSSIEVALACGADGVHLGYGSLPLEAARRLMPGKTVGVSIHSVEEGLQAQSGGADYVLAGHIYPTVSKPGQPGKGIEFITLLASAISIPIIGIGGINDRNAGEVIDAGSSGVAVMSLVMESRDIKSTVTALRHSLSK